jgi:hypothetical protein
MTNKSQQTSHNSFKIKAHTNVDNKKRVCYICFIKYKHRRIEMSDVNIDWKGKALAAEAETLNLKNLCAHHGICTVCREYYSHHYTEPFATCKCNTSEWYEITEHMKLQDELRKLREDADRYKWLRDAGATFYTGGLEITDGSDKVHVCEFAMDAAIDAARGNN